METYKILVFNWRDTTHPQTGGAEVHISEISKRWVKWGHEVTLFCGKYLDCKEYDFIDGIEIIRKGGPFTVYINAIKEYLGNLIKNNYDVIIDDINGVPFFTPLYVKKPIVTVIHHLVKDIFFKELRYHKAIIGYLSENIIPYIYKNTPIITVSENTKTDLVNFGIPKKNINVIYNGIDHIRYRPNIYHKSSYPLLVYIGRVKKYKNINHILNAIKYLINQNLYICNNLKLIIAGRGNYNDIISKINHLGIYKYVTILGEISDDLKIELLNKAWVYITTSSKEGWGLTVIEANACGTPVISYKVPGLMESIIDDKTGILVPYGNVKLLSNAILKIISDNEYRDKLSRDAIKWAKNFNWIKTANETLKIIEKVN